MDFTTYLQIVVYTFPIFLFSLSVHEAAHAITAYWGGDATSAFKGRITLNPISHIDPIGTILIPLFAPLLGIPLIGWAKPVPVNSLNFRRGDGYDVVVAMAGPFSNLLIALFTVAIFQIFFLMYSLGWIGDEKVFEVGRTFFIWMVQINILLMFFNLIPVPPLDGSWLVWHFFAKNHPVAREIFERVRGFGMFILLLLLWLGVIGVYFTLVVRPISLFLFDLALLPVNLVS